MGYDGQGTVYIPLEEFWKFVKKFHPTMDEAMVRYANEVRIQNEDLEIDFAFGTETDPLDWSEPPKFLKRKASL
jgi:hypothetical protein